MDKKLEDAAFYYGKITGGLSGFDELLQKPPTFSELGEVERLVLISDKWNYQSIFLETSNVYVGCHWDTSE